MSGFKFNTKGAEVKIKRALAIAEFFKQIHRDAAAFLVSKLRNEVLNLPNTSRPGHPEGNSFIRRISGNLARSISLRPGLASTTIYVNISIAPYAVKVAEYSEKRFGKNYVDIVVMLYGEYVDKVIREEFLRAVNAANNPEVNYSYENKFVAAAA